MIKIIQNVSQLSMCNTFPLDSKINLYSLCDYFFLNCKFLCYFLFIHIG